MLQTELELEFSQTLVPGLSKVLSAVARLHFIASPLSRVLIVKEQEPLSKSKRGLLGRRNEGRKGKSTGGLLIYLL